jgi:hypothetical protein
MMSTPSFLLVILFLNVVSDVATATSPYEFKWVTTTMDAPQNHAMIRTVAADASTTLLFNASSADDACTQVAYAIRSRIEMNRPTRRPTYNPSDANPNTLVSTRVAYQRCNMSSCVPTCALEATYTTHLFDFANDMLVQTVFHATIELETAPCNAMYTPGVASCRFHLCNTAVCKSNAAYLAVRGCTEDPNASSVSSSSVRTPKTCVAGDDEDWTDEVYVARRMPLGTPLADVYECATFIDASTGDATQPSYAPSGDATRPCKIVRCPPGFVMSADVFPTCTDDIIGQCMRPGANTTDFPWLLAPRAHQPLLCGMRAQMCDLLGYWQDARLTQWPQRVSLPWPSLVWSCVCARGDAGESFNFVLVSELIPNESMTPDLTDLRAIVHDYDVAYSLAYRNTLHLNHNNPCPEPAIRTQPPLVKPFPAASTLSANLTALTPRCEPVVAYNNTGASMRCVYA